MTRQPTPYAGGTHVGRVRSGNEDAYLVNPPLFAVADGLGGHQAGEVASKTAIDVLLDAAPRSADGKGLARAVRSANAAVIEAARTGIGRTGMGTTLTAAMVEGTRIVVAHAGDSRAYLLHLGELVQITQDHSMVADMVRSGTLTAEESRFHPNRSVITRALGSDPGMSVDVYDVTAAPGDRLLLSSDGLTSMLTDPEIAHIVGSAPTPAEAVARLIDASNEAGGHDNITAVVVDIGTDLHQARATSRTGVPAETRAAGLTRTWAARLLWTLALVGVIGGAVYGAYAYARSQAFVIDERGYVAVYRGVPGSLGGITLSWLESVSDVPVSALDPVTVGRLRSGIRVESVDAAHGLVTQYRTEAGVPSPTNGSVEPTTTP